MEFEKLKFAYINISGNFYPNDYINLTRIIDDKINFDEKTLFLDETIKKSLNNDEIKKLEDIVIIFNLEGSWGILCNTPIKYYQEKKVLCHELVLADVIQRMLNNFHFYNTEANPVILTHNKKLFLEEFTKENLPCYKLEDSKIKLFVYSNKEAEEILKMLEDIEYFYIADGHHRLYSTSLFKKKKTVMSCIYEIDEMKIEAIPRKIKNISKDKFNEIKGKIKKKFILISNDKKLEKGEVRLRYQNEIVSFKLLESEEDLFANNDIYRINTQLISDIFRIFKDEDIEFLSLSELEKEISSQTKEIVYLEISSMLKKEFIETINQGNIMPPKSTYFRPKFPSFLVFNKFEK